MVYTLILEPFNDEIYEEKEIKAIKNRWENIKEELSKSQSEAITFEKFRQNLRMTNYQYIEAVRSSLKTKRLFLKCSVSETRVNAYNPILLKMWRANMDLQ